jgi:hypothetical protein
MADQLLLLSRDEVKEITGWDDVMVDEYISLANIVRDVSLPPEVTLVPPSASPEIYAFSGAWVNFGTIYEEAGFYKTADSIVRLQGYVKSGSSGSTVFTLPEGYRPQKTSLFAAASLGGANAYILVNSNGSVVAVGSTVTSSGVSLENVSFCVR